MLKNNRETDTFA